MRESRRFRMWLVLLALTIFSYQSDISYSQTTTNLLQPSDLVYKGAFLLAEGPGEASVWAFGANALTYNPTGDPNGPNDGYPGSLFGSSHVYQKMVAEVTIPAPAFSTNPMQLPRTTTLQPFKEITGGLQTQVVDPNGNLGLVYLPKQNGQPSDKLYWLVYKFYNVTGDNNDTVGSSEPTLSTPQQKGLWHVGPYHAMTTSRYMLQIPKSWADIYTPGKLLGAGRHREAGCCGSGKGPALFAFTPWTGTSAPAPGTALDAKPLIFYPEAPIGYGSAYNLAGVPEGPRHYPDYKACDEWSGAAWVTTATKSAVIFVGTKALGPVYYGDGKPGAMSPAKGYHCDPYEPQFIFYNPDDLAAVAQGQKDPGGIVPYAIFRPAQYFYQTGQWYFGGVTYDSARGLLYVVQMQGASFGYPVVHVFSVGQGSGTPTTNPPTTTPPTTTPPPPPPPALPPPPVGVSVQ